MASNKQAKSKIRKSIRTLQDTLFTKKMTPEQRKRIKFSLDLLFDAFNDLAGLPSNLTYSDAAGHLKVASARLKKIKQERDQLANSLATASKILNSINGVLGLV